MENYEDRTRLDELEDDDHYGSDSTSDDHFHQSPEDALLAGDDEPAQRRNSSSHDRGSVGNLLNVAASGLGLGARESSVAATDGDDDMNEAEWLAAEQRNSSEGDNGS